MRQLRQKRSEKLSCQRFFEDAVERVMDRLYGTALRLTRNAADAEDLVADTLAKAWANIDTLQDRRRFENWVFRILINTLISDRRRKQARPVEEVPERDDDDPFSLFDRLHQPFLLWSGNPEQRLLDKVLRKDIERAVDALPEEFRVTVVLVEIWGFSYTEAAEALDVPVGTVRSRLSRGRSQLQRALWRQASQLGITAGSAKGDLR
jgi:RNA polymerase sigma-70 factor, ECF subfamily